MDPLINDEAIKDQGALNSHPSYTDKDFEGHRAHSVYVGVHIGKAHQRHPRRRHRHHHHRHHKRGDSEDSDTPLTPPAQRVQFILGEEEDELHETHPLFSEMEELFIEGDEMEWRETARWVKFEEDVEEGGNRWSKPHVATLSLHSLFELRSCILNGTVMLDVDANNLEQIADLVLENMVNANQVPEDARGRIKEVLLRRHRHQHERRHDKENNKGSRIPLIRSLAEIGRVHSSSKSIATEGVSPTPTSPTPLNEPHQFGRFLLPSKQAAAVTANACCSSQTVATTTATTTNAAVPPSNPVVKAVHFQPIHGSSNTAEHGMQQSASGTSLSRNHSGNHLQSNHSHSTPADLSSTASATDMQQLKVAAVTSAGNQHFMKKIPPGSEASNILVGELQFLERTICAFVRLTQALHLGDLTEVPIPTRFIFLLLGPTGYHERFHEIGRATATLMSDEVFHDVAYKGKSRQDLLAGVDEFLDAVTVLPPGEWDPSIRIEPPSKIPSQDRRKAPDSGKDEVNEEEEEERIREENGLKRSGRLFGGLINDIRRKVPLYWSDFKDALAIQCLASFIFLYFACLTPIITFGGLLGEATGNNMAAMESLVSGFVCGLLYGLFSGQPLTLLSSTGPVLVFETICYSFCTDFELDYMSFRLWIGLWTGLILVVLVALDASAFVCYITRFTEENFACLISLIFIYNAVVKVCEVGNKYPVDTHSTWYYSDCHCFPSNQTTDPEAVNWTLLTRAECKKYNGTLIGENCRYYPDVFLMSLLQFGLTFVISYGLKEIKTTSFFPAKVRAIINDFAVIIAILSVSLLDFCVGLDTPKLDVPDKFEPTRKDRSWVIPFMADNPWWAPLAAVVPALLCTILIFMDQQITAVIVNRHENKLKKGGGYHLDLFVLAILIMVCSIMGLPWFVAGTVLSVTHVNSLKVESECAAPGEKPQFLGVREQRVTHILIFIMIGSSAALTSVLKFIPMPVLFGVFLYMGISSLKGLQFFDRMLIMFMPVKYQPDYVFLRQVPLRRVHMFTSIQLCCLIALWILKAYKPTSIAFPLLLVVMIGLRKCLDFIFTQRELKILDDMLPESTRRKREEEKEMEKEIEQAELRAQTDNVFGGSDGNLEIQLFNGNVVKIPMENIHLPEREMNISEEINKTGSWKQVNCDKVGNGRANPMADYNSKDKKSEANHKKKRGSKKDAMNEEERKRLSTMAEEDDCDDDTPIMIKVDSPTSIVSTGGSTKAVDRASQNETSV